MEEGSHSEGWKGVGGDAPVPHGSSPDHWHHTLRTAHRAAATNSSICHCHFPGMWHCSGNCLRKARAACAELQQGSHRTRVLETAMGLCVLLCAPARVINNRDKFLSPSHVTVLDSASSLLSPLPRRLALPGCAMIDVTGQQMTAG